MVEALVDAVGDGAVVEERGEHAAHREQDLGLALHIEEGLLLAGEGGFREVFGGGRGAHRDRGTAGDARAQGAVALDDGAFEFRLQRCIEDPAADARTHLGEAGHIVDIEVGQRIPDTGVEPVARKQPAVGLGGGGEAARHLHAEPRQRADEFADGGVLAAHALHIVHGDLLERHYESVHGCSGVKLWG